MRLERTPGTKPRAVPGALRTCIIRRYRMPGHKRPFRVPLAVGRLPVLPLLAIASIALLLSHFDWQIYVAGGIALAASALAFGIRQWFRR